MTFWTRIFSFDTRALATARILTGVLLIIDLISRSTHLVAHYTDKGVLPQVALFEELPDTAFPSIYMSNETPIIVSLLFCFHALAALSLTLGYRTRLSTILCWYLTASLQFRNPLINIGGDVLLRLLLFWCIFIPWGEVWSLDRLMSRKAGRSQIASVATSILGLQMVLLYISSTLNKWHPTWTTEGTALYYALSVDHITTPYAIWLYRHPELMKYLTFLVLGAEFLGGLLLLVPSVRLRLFLIPTFLSMHYCFGLFLEIGNFRYAPMVGLLAFMPSVFWDKLPKRRLSRKTKASLLKWLRRFPWRARPDREWNNKGLSYFLIGAFAYGVLTCVQGLIEQTILPAPVDKVGHALGLNQHWPMFIYLDKVKDGWYIIHAEFEDGTGMDLIHGGEVSWDKPTSVGETYDGVRWRRFMTNIVLPPTFSILPWYSQYIRRDWARRHPDKKLKKLTLYFMNDPQNLHYRFTPPEKKVMHTWERPEGGEAEEASAK